MVLYLGPLAFGHVQFAQQGLDRPQFGQFLQPPALGGQLLPGVCQPGLRLIMGALERLPLLGLGHRLPIALPGLFELPRRFIEDG